MTVTHPWQREIMCVLWEPHKGVQAHTVGEVTALTSSQIMLAQTVSDDGAKSGLKVIPRSRVIETRTISHPWLVGTEVTPEAAMDRARKRNGNVGGSGAGAL